VIQIQNCRYRKNAADLTVRCRVNNLANEQELNGDLQWE